MGLFSRFKSMTMRFPARYRSGASFLLPQTEFDYARAVGDGRGSSLIMTCALWAGRTFPEAPLRVQETRPGESPSFLPTHPMEALVESPNPFYSGVVLWMASIMDFVISGNFYWIKVRSSLGEPVQLWYIPSFMIEPQRNDKDRTVYISHYAYRPNLDEQPIKIPVEDVVHVRMGIDPNNPIKGVSPVTTLLREVFTDNEAANFAAALLKNLGIPGVILSPADSEAEASDDDLAEVKETFMRRFGGDNRGEPMVLKTKTDVKVLSWSPQQLDLRALRRIPEERVSAIMGIPAIVAGFGAGLDRSTFANFKEAREAAFESMIAPNQRLVAAEVTRSLLRDFDRMPARRAAFDNSNVRILEEDENHRWDRYRGAYEGGGITRAEYRTAIGLHHDMFDEVYVVRRSHILIPINADGSAITIGLATKPGQDVPGVDNEPEDDEENDTDSIDQKYALNGHSREKVPA